MNTISSKVLTIDFGLVKKYIYVVKPITVTQLYIPVVKLNIVEKYNKDLKETEGSYLDVVIRSEGAVSYQDIMTMPIDSIRLMVERMNARFEEINKSRKNIRQ